MFEGLVRPVPVEEVIVRRYDDPVQVRLAAPATPGAGDGAGRGTGDLVPAVARPDAFLWRDRLYVVREVYGSWLEREAWWESSPRGGSRPSYERRVWRVEAGAGRHRGTGVYDLARVLPVPVLSGAGTGAGDAGAGAGAEQGWRLLCHLD